MGQPDFCHRSILAASFCAFCFFNGTELMRAVMAWPGELIYARPSSAIQTAKIVMPHTVTEMSGSEARDSSEGARDRAGEPFGPDVGSLDQTRPFTLSAPNNGGNSVLTSPPLSAIVWFVTGAIDWSCPGTDALSQIFDRAVADLEQAKILDAKRTVVLIQTPLSAEARARAAASLKAARQQLANAKVTAAQAARNAQQKAGASAVTATNAATSSTGSTVGNLGRPGVGLGGGIGGVGRGVGLPGGGVGGLGGGRH